MRWWLAIPSVVYFLSISAFAGAIHDAAKKGDATAIEAALASGVDVDELGGGATPLYFAARRGHLEAARLLISRGANVNAETNLGTPLMAAVERSKKDMIALLLEKGANPNQRVADVAPLHTAAKLQCFECLRALVEAGADVNAQTPDNQTPLHIARRLGTKEMAGFLLEHGVVLPRPAPIYGRLANASVERGQKTFNSTCRLCHHAERDKGNYTGPNLWNVVGRKKASVPDFTYTEALLALQGEWSFEDLNTFIAAPRASVPGTRMDIGGILDDAERANLIAYLRIRADSPVPLP